MSDSDMKSARTWQKIAAEAAIEKDSDKLLQLAVELDRALEEREKKLTPATRDLNTPPQN